MWLIGRLGRCLRQDGESKDDARTQKSRSFGCSDGAPKGGMGHLLHEQHTLFLGRDRYSRFAPTTVVATGRTGCFSYGAPRENGTPSYGRCTRRDRNSHFAPTIVMRRQRGVLLLRRPVVGYGKHGDVYRSHLY